MFETAEEIGSDFFLFDKVMEHNSSFQLEICKETNRNKFRPYT